MPNTTKGYPYPEGSDAVDVPGDIQALADAVDASPGVTSYTSTQIAALSAGEKWAGRVIWNSTAGKLQVSNGSTFTDVDTSVALSSSTPQTLGTAAAGTSSDASRADHRHAMPSASDVGAISNALVNAKGDLITATANDTPAILTVGTNGHVLTADSAATNGIKWAALPSSDLALIDTVTVSASATLNVNNAFSATYQNYLIVVRLLGTGAVNCTLRLRASGSDATGSDYAVQDLIPNGTNTNPSRATGTSFRAFALGDTNHSAGTIHVFAPNAAERTQFTSFVVAGNDGVATYLPTCQHQLATAYDGFSLTAGSGTMTGVVRVYGYKGA